MGGKKGIITLSSHVVRGSVGNRAIVYALETLGHPVWSVPTIVLPWQPEHGRAAPILAEDSEFAGLLAMLAEAPWLDEIGAVLSGYLGSTGQAESIARLVTALKHRNPQLIYACDPVIGDFGGLYVPEERAAAIRDRLLPLADIATPNRFELQWLTASREMEVETAARNLGPARVVVTSAWEGKFTGSLLVTPEKSISARHAVLSGAPKGLGDFIAATFLAHVLDGLDDAEALRRATASVLELIGRSAAAGANRLLLELGAEALLRPHSELHLDIAQLQAPGVCS